MYLYYAYQRKLIKVTRHYWTSNTGTCLTAHAKLSQELGDFLRQESSLVSCLITYDSHIAVFSEHLVAQGPNVRGFQCFLLVVPGNCCRPDHPRLRR